MKKLNTVKITLLLAAMMFAFAGMAQVETKSGSKRPAGQKADDPAGRIKVQIEKLNQDIIEAAIKQDVKASMAFYTDDAISLPNYGEMMKGKAAIKAHMEEMMKSGMKMTAMNFTTLEVSKVGNDILEIGTFKVTMVSPEWASPMTEEGKYLTIWEKKEKGDMKIKLEIWNSDEHPMAKMAKMKPEQPPAPPVEKAPAEEKKP